MCTCISDQPSAAQQTFNEEYNEPVTPRPRARRLFADGAGRLHGRAVDHQALLERIYEDKNAGADTLAVAALID